LIYYILILNLRVERSASRGACYDHMGDLLAIAISIQAVYFILPCLLKLRLLK